MPIFHVKFVLAAEITKEIEADDETHALFQVENGLGRIISNVSQESNTVDWEVLEVSENSESDLNPNEEDDLED